VRWPQFRLSARRTDYRRSPRGRRLTGNIATYGAGEGQLHALAEYD